MCLLPKSLLLGENRTENRRSNETVIDSRIYLHEQNPIIRLNFWQNEHQLNHVVVEAVEAVEAATEYLTFKRFCNKVNNECINIFTDWKMLFG